MRTTSPFAYALLTLTAGVILPPTIGCRAIIGVEDPVSCSSDDNCNLADEPCVVGECIEGACAYSLLPAGTVIDEAGEDDCKRNECNADGQLVSVIDASDAPADATPGDCRAPACQESGLIDAPADDPPADEAPGDCLVPACEDGSVVQIAGQDPPTNDAAGDCQRPTCVDGAPVSEADPSDAPDDETPGDCSSPACSAEGAVITVDNLQDTPAEDVDGDCRVPTYEAGGQLAIDDTDTPTSGCGSCAGGNVVPWAEESMACYTGPSGTQNVGICVGGTWACENNVKLCSGEVTPAQEQCGPGFSGVNEDCDGQTDEDGPGCACMLGQSQSCYTFPTGTPGVGICAAGTSTCTATGQGNQYGACVGQVGPQACDSCLVAGDQDCSGTASTCTGEHVWSRAVGNAGSDEGGDALVLDDGTIVAVGTFSGSLTVGASNLTSDGGSDIMVVRYDADGNVINARDFGGSSSDAGGSLVKLSDGYVLSGYLGGGSAENFGSGATLSSVGGDGFIAKFNTNHTVAWKKLLGGTSGDYVTGIARMPDNGVVAVGQFGGTINLGGSNLSSAGNEDIFLVRYAADGTHVWSKRFGSSGQEEASGLAVAPNGDIVLVGSLNTAFNFGGSNITPAGGFDGFVVRFDLNGNHQWTRAFQSAGNEQALKVGVLSTSEVWVAGKFDTAVNLDGVAGTEISPTSTGQDLLLVKYAANGSYLMSKSYNCTGTSTWVNDLHIGSDDAVVMSGSYAGTMFFGVLGSVSAGSSDAFLLKIAPGDGAHRWARRYGGTGADRFGGFGLTSCGDIITAGNFNGSVSFGGGNLPNAGLNDAVFARYRQ